MKPVYVQHLLKVLLEEYQDIDYMLDTVSSGKLTRRDSEKIRRLLSQLSQQNDKLLDKFESAQEMMPASVGVPKRPALRRPV